MYQVIEQKSHCPYCGEVITLLIDTSIAKQSYIEDCEVCCRPIRVEAMMAVDGTCVMNLYHENE